MESYHDSQLRTLSGLERRVYDAAEESDTVEDMLLRVALNSPGSSVGKAIRRLVQIGLLEPAGKSKTHAQQYRRTKSENAKAAAAAAQQVAVAPAKPQAKRQTAGSRLSDMTTRRVREKGEWKHWYQMREQILRETVALTQIDAMAFWDAAPENEIDQVLYEVLELRAWVDGVVESLGQRQHDDKLQALIDKMLENTNGRPAAEVEVAEEMARRRAAKMFSAPRESTKVPTKPKKFPNPGTTGRRVYEFVIAQGDHGATGEEIAAAISMDRGTVTPRLNELRRGGWLAHDGERPTPQGGKTKVFVATDKPTP